MAADFLSAIEFRSLSPHLRHHPARDRQHPGDEAEHVPFVEDAVAEVALDEGVGPGVALGRGGHARFRGAFPFFQKRV